MNQRDRIADKLGYKDAPGFLLGWNARDSQIKILTDALEFYASGEHFVEYGGANYTADGKACPNYTDAENPSGEPLNYFEGHGDYGFEDGSIARKALEDFEKSKK